MICPHCTHTIITKQGILFCEQCNTEFGKDDKYKPGINYDIKKRRLKENGHNIKSFNLYKRLSELDWFYGDDFFDFKAGGDGDNGEHLMDLLDIYFEEGMKT